MKTKHTPGLWVVTPAEANKLCLFRHSEVRTGNKRIGWVLWENDARLIAAAPDLLEACKRLKLQIESIISEAQPAERLRHFDAILNGHTDVLRVADAAIAKAGGEL